MGLIECELDSAGDGSASGDQAVLVTWRMVRAGAAVLARQDTDAETLEERVNEIYLAMTGALASSC